MYIHFLFNIIPYINITTTTITAQTMEVSYLRQFFQPNSHSVELVRDVKILQSCFTLTFNIKMGAFKQRATHTCTEKCINPITVMIRKVPLHRRAHWQLWMQSCCVRHRESVIVISVSRSHINIWLLSLFTTSLGKFSYSTDIP